MITRFVKMTFQQGKEEDFLKIFNASFENIRNFKGCKYLELLEDVNQKNIFFTHSIWESEELLNSYRQSELFKKTWKATKALFSDKPRAWSLINKSTNE
ncbi:MAG: antibiotic biosynthesis monooxygenase [Bacteroidetes bacterium]|nr:antibiotic biosynthesis monooxygenase [Bacteroidota bacterium]